jgi:hypothetical protein
MLVRGFDNCAGEFLEFSWNRSRDRILEQEKSIRSRNCIQTCVTTIHPDDGYGERLFGNYRIS